MSSKPMISPRSSCHQSVAFPLSLFAILIVALLPTWSCGHKSAPIPPPLRHPAASRDLVVQQRGDEFILSFGFPQTTVSGTPLEPLAIVEVWELVRRVPEWVPPTADDTDAVSERHAEPADASADEPAPDVFERGSGSGDDPSQPDEIAIARTDDQPGEPETPAEEGDVPAADEGGKSTEMAVAEALAEEIEPEVVRPSDENLLVVDANEFIATAQLRITVEEPLLSAASFGDRLVLNLAIETPKATPPPAAPAEEGAELEAPPRYGSILAVKTSVGGRFTSNFSNTVVIAHRTAPEPPAAFALEPGPDKIAVSWPRSERAPDEDLVGFNVYRRDAQSPSYGPPLAFVPIESLSAAPATAADLADHAAAAEPATYEHSDRTAVLGQRYIYALTAVSNRTPVVESVVTVEREVDYADRFAPRPPRNLITLAETGRIQILWDASREPDLAGYFVFRRGADGTFAKLNQEPLTEPEFSDREVQGGRSYGYRVTAIDLSDNESEPSVTVEVRAP